MPVFFLSLLGFAKTYWKPLLIGGLALVLIVGAYLKGGRDCARRQEAKTLRTLQELQEAANKERGRTEAEDRRIDANRAARPLDDRRDSCLLSSDPYTTQCVE